MGMRLFIKVYGMMLLTAVLIIVTIWGWNYAINLPAPSTRSVDDFGVILLDSHPELFTSDNKPVFTIDSSNKPTANWYILKLSPKDGNGPSSFAIVNDPHFGREYMKVIAGPESKFSRQELTSKGQLIPSEVITTLEGEGAL